MSKLTAKDERLQRANTHCAEAAKRGQDHTHMVAEALADLRELSAHLGVSFSLASEMSRTKYIYDRVNKEG